MLLKLEKRGKLLKISGKFLPSQKAHQKRPKPVTLPGVGLRLEIGSFVAAGLFGFLGRPE